MHDDIAQALMIAEGRHPDPFAFLGPHQGKVRTYQPGAERVEVLRGEEITPLLPIGDTGVFVGPGERPYRLRVHWRDTLQETEDPYAFPPILGDVDLHLFSEGAHWELAERFGSSVERIDGIGGVRFAVWAPNARRVSVVGDFNAWDGRRHPMRLRRGAGVWEIFIPRLTAGERYKYEIMGPDGALLPLKADPLARAAEHPPANASIVPQCRHFHWTDADWMARREAAQAPDAPISIYEVHAASWLRPEHGETIDWRGLEERLIPYVGALGFTHIELLPIMEHPFGGSWGYQPLSQFAPSARYGAAEAFAHFIDACHRAGIGVILDWVPAHFPSDAHGLARFDGTALYEHADPREGFHRDWNTLIYNLGRREVQGFLIASALFWLEHFHVDGLRVDAVASMLYRDYSRKEGEWIPNRHGGRENLEAIDFLKRLNAVVRERVPGAITIAEESTAWPGVTSPEGLGFSYKWNMGWMHDTLGYVGHEPVHRRWHHHAMTFGLVYAWSEKFVLPLSHDEVVHGKGSLYGRMPGDAWQKLATLRAYFAFMWTHPGRKLLFMGGELASPREWNHDGELDWDLLRDAGHAGVQRLIGDLNRLYVREAALHACDDDPGGFRWAVGDDSANSVFAYERGNLLVVVNMTPVPRTNYRIPVSRDGTWRELLNTDSEIYGGSNVGNAGQTEARDGALTLTLPPLATLVLG
ncbi:MAG: 1,4-alpha-glucan branching protein GlgB [Alphaproteobacteria bacterium]|nr:1,4-alpha-glucan branching protein GlgB [Alphaproteobacteria bacterium]